MPGKGAVRRGKARLQRGQCKTLAALFFLLYADDIMAGSRSRNLPRNSPRRGLGMKRRAHRPRRPGVAIAAMRLLAGLTLIATTESGSSCVLNIDTLHDRPG